MSAPTNCDGCGACCMYFMVATRTKFREDEIQWYEMHGVLAKENGLMVHAPCKNFDWETRKCKIYEQRPKCCREAKVGDKNCIYSRLHMKSLGVMIDE